MCGIFGGIGKLNLDKINILGILNQERGIDSTGIFDNVSKTKAVLKFSDFTVDYRPVIENYKEYIVGHTRYATTGKKTERNAHPFTFGNITGVHNGIIDNFAELKAKYNQNKLQCDSEIIFYLLDSKGIEGLKELQGYFAIVFRDNRSPDKLFFIKHTAEFAYLLKNDSLYFASDSEHLKVAFFNENILEAEENTLYQIDINTLEIVKNKVEGLHEYSFKVLKSVKPLEYHGIECEDITDEDFDYCDYFNCPQCKEEITLGDAESGHCPSCFLQLTGSIYVCNYCEGVIHTKRNKRRKHCKHCEKKSINPQLLLTFDNVRKF